jgi:proton glutamate symport protein
MASITTARISPLLILGGLVIGLLLGLEAARSSPDAAAVAVSILEPVGTLWLRALQMTIIPLVVSLLFTGIVSAVAAASAGRLASWSVLYFFAVLWTGAIISAVLTPLLLQWFPLAPAAAAALRGSIDPNATLGDVPSFGAFISSFVPTNPVAAAANDAVLPLIVFTVAFAVAATRIDAARRDQLNALFTSIADAMLVIIGWVLTLAPIGVAALAFTVAARTGTAALGGFVHYILIVSAVGTVVWLLGYPLGILAGGKAPLAFARAALPAQAVAISTQSSLASLPAMLKGTARLAVRPTSADVTLPLAVALFRSTGPAMNLAVAIYVAYLTNVPLTPGTLAIGVAVAATTTLSAVSLPGSISFISSIGPIALAMGVPLEPLALLIAVETLPDIIRTVGNVTNDIAAAAVVDRHAGSPALLPHQENDHAAA